MPYEHNWHRPPQVNNLRQFFCSRHTLCFSTSTELQRDRETHSLHPTTNVNTTTIVCCRAKDGPETRASKKTKGELPPTGPCRCLQRRVQYLRSRQCFNNGTPDTLQNSPRSMRLRFFRKRNRTGQNSHRALFSFLLANHRQQNIRGKNRNGHARVSVSVNGTREFDTKAGERQATHRPGNPPSSPPTPLQRALNLAPVTYFGVYGRRRRTIRQAGCVVPQRNHTITHNH
ncbi:unnamed protein product [Ectocarpus sp. 12 AP-2014]